MEQLDGILLAGGDDCDPAHYNEERHPSCVELSDVRRQQNDLALAKFARQHGIPTLGICLGLQMMNVANGGSLIQDIDSQFETELQHASKPESRVRHDIMIEQGTHLSTLLPAVECNVNSSHHQAIGRVAEGLRITAHAPDGLVEGLEDPKHPFYIGVQWHPEDMSGEHSATALFEAFVKAAREYAQEKTAVAAR
jgi:putative glutamine amidotransferase